MTVNDVLTLLKKTEIPVGYSVFDEEQELPFLLLQEGEQRNMHADNDIWATIVDASVELYTEHVDARALELIRIVDSLLSSVGIPRKQLAPSYIDDEDMHLIAWSIQIF